MSQQLLFPFLLIVGVIVVLVMRLVSASTKNSELSTRINELSTRTEELAAQTEELAAQRFNQWKRTELELAAHRFNEWKRAELELATQRFNAWKETEIESVKQQASQVADGQAAINFQLWKQEYEKSIRADAHLRSKAVTTGKVLEHMAPHLPEFFYNPKDARFIGNPVDYVVFDGLDDGAVRQVVFVEVKTGNSALTAKQQRIKEVIESGKVKWYDLRISDGAAASMNAAGPLTPPQPISVSARSEVVLPDLGDATSEVTIARWPVGPVRAGLRVRHQQFGVGTVVAVEERNDHLRITVQFASSVGVKMLHSNYAKLEPA